MDSLKAKEIENGRLAMTAMLGAGGRPAAAPCAAALWRARPRAASGVSDRAPPSPPASPPPGFFVQAMVTGDGPYANLQAHLSDPVNNNILSKCAPPAPLRLRARVAVMLPLRHASDTGALNPHAPRVLPPRSMAKIGGAL